VLLLCSLFVPLAGGWVVSAVLQPIYVVGRHDVLVLPLYLLIVAHGISLLRRPGLYTMAAVASILAFTGLVPYYPTEPFVYLKGTARFLARTARPGDYVLFTDLASVPIEYYLGKKKSTLVLAYYPRCLDRHSSWYRYERFAYKRYGHESQGYERYSYEKMVGEVETLRREAMDIAREAASSLGEGGVLWVVYKSRERDRAISQFLENPLRELFDKVAEYQIAHVQVHEYSPRQLRRKGPEPGK